LASSEAIGGTKTTGVRLVNCGLRVKNIRKYAYGVEPAGPCFIFLALFTQAQSRAPFSHAGEESCPPNSTIQIMKLALRFLVLLTLVVTPVALHASDTMADIVKAQVVLGKVVQLMTKYAQYAITLEAPTPKANTKGKYLLPYNTNGELTEWATKTFNVKLGAMAGEKAGGMAGNAVASKVPLGGLASGFMKKKGKEMGAVAALGGQKYITSTSSMSFDKLDDYAVYLQVTHGKEAGLQQALAAAMAIYPELEAGYDVAVNKAYQRALLKKK
jgi:hypothetical protein